MAEHSETHAHDSHGDAHHGVGHVLSPLVLLGTWGSLMVLTVLTVLAAGVDFGSPALDLTVAMVIAVVKASLVCLFFMHLRYDKLMHTVVFLSALLFFMLFAGFCLMDRGEYRDTIRWNPVESPEPF